MTPSAIAKRHGRAAMDLVSNVLGDSGFGSEKIGRGEGLGTSPIGTSEGERRYQEIGMGCELKADLVLALPLVYKYVSFYVDEKTPQLRPLLLLCAALTRCDFHVGDGKRALTPSEMGRMEESALTLTLTLTLTLILMFNKGYR